MEKHPDHVGVFQEHVLEHFGNPGDDKIKHNSDYHHPH